MEKEHAATGEKDPSTHLFLPVSELSGDDFSVSWLSSELVVCTKKVVKFTRL
jgi:hypothetical protein